MLLVCYLRELELHPPAEEWHRRNTFGGPWSDPDDLGVDDSSRMSTSDSASFSSGDSNDFHHEAQRLWPRKRRMSERDAAFGLNTSTGLGAYLGIMGSRRDVVTAVWKTGLEGVWFKCIRCLCQTSGNNKLSTQSERETSYLLKVSGRRDGSAGGFMAVQCVEGHGFVLYRRLRLLSFRMTVNLKYIGSAKESMQH